MSLITHLVDFTLGKSYLIDKLIASDPGDYDGFGNAASIYENTAVIGARQCDVYDDPTTYVYSGCVYIFKYNNFTGNWNQTQKLVSDTLNNRTFFGTSVLINQDHIFIGATGANSVYIYRQNKSLEYNDWYLIQTVESSSVDGEAFGVSISVSNDFLVVGDTLNGYVYVYMCICVYVYICMRV